MAGDGIEVRDVPGVWLWRRRERSNLRVRHRTFTRIVLALSVVAGCTSGGDPVSAGSTLVGVDTSSSEPVETVVSSTSTVVVTSPATTMTQEEGLGPFAAGVVQPGEQGAFLRASDGGVGFEYLLYIPEGHDGDETWPVIVFLHGFLGFSDHSIEAVRSANPLVWRDPTVDFPFVVISPLAPSGMWHTLQDPLNDLLDDLEEPLNLDRGSVFLTGASAGAVGVWQWALEHPDTFTGIAPVAGAAAMFAAEAVPGDLCRLTDLPVWAGHGDADTEAPLERHSVVIESLRECGSTVVQFTVYEDQDHIGSIETFYADPILYDWILQASSP